ncbi:MAG: radical SAM protein [Oscillospiraceae bacterium]|jgi:DNA repair photolyase|nr:radical SAM protein [Oscillospiraceae bacterium]
MHYKQYKSILSAQNGMNLYRGCTHGCIYCDSRSLCYQFDHDFEDIEVKTDAVAMLERELRRKRKPCMVGTGAMCDPYTHLETELCVTRQSLEVILRYGFGLSIQTKSARILRDIDLLDAINQQTKCVVQMTLTTHDDELCRILEPNVSVTSERFDALCALRERGIPTVVWISPILPFINDTCENLLGLLDYCTRADVRGIMFFGAGMTLRDGNREYFYRALDRHFPDVKQRYIERFGNAYVCNSPRDAELTALVDAETKKRGMIFGNDAVFAYLRKFDDSAARQVTLF